MKPDLGEVILYQSEDGEQSLDVHLRDETVWLTQKQIAALFATERSVVTKHIGNVFRTGELDREAVCAKFAHTAEDGKTYRTTFYNLDVIIAVGYRVNAIRGTQFRIWATQVLKEHLVRGYTLHKQRLAEKGIEELKQALALAASTLENRELISEEGRAVLEVVTRYARTWQLLLQYDEERLSVPESRHTVRVGLRIEDVRQAVAALKMELMARGEATDFFGQERSDGLEGIIAGIDQTFGGHELYPDVESKAAHLLYFVIKDHPFIDGNKRIASFLFVLYLQQNGLQDGGGFNNRALVALALLIAASEPGHKDLLVRLVMNLITEEKSICPNLSSPL